MKPEGAPHTHTGCHPTACLPALAWTPAGEGRETGPVIKALGNILGKYSLQLPVLLGSLPSPGLSLPSPGKAGVKVK